jgi:hypothetical protein
MEALEQEKEQLKSKHGLNRKENGKVEPRPHGDRSNPNRVDHSQEISYHVSKYIIALVRC